MKTAIKPRSLHAAGIVLWLLAATLGTGQPASAHNASDFYFHFWQNGNLTVPWRFTSGVTNSNMRDRAKDGARQWNQENQPLTLDFENGANDYAEFDGFSCPANRPFQKDAVHWQSFSDSGRSPGLGETNKCIDGTTGFIHDAQLIINSDYGGSYYNGTGSPGNNEYDSWSVFTHEFGHVTGWSLHFTVNGPQCDGGPSQRMTMCGFFGFNAEQGASWRRDLGAHDQDTFNDAY